MKAVILVEGQDKKVREVINSKFSNQDLSSAIALIEPHEEKFIDALIHSLYDYVKSEKISKKDLKQLALDQLILSRRSHFGRLQFTSEFIQSLSSKTNFDQDKIINKLQLVSREEFEVLKKIVQKQDKIIKKLENKKTNRAKKS